MTTILNAHHSTDLAEWTSSSGAIAWDGRAGLAGTAGGLKVPVTATEASVTKTFTAVSNTVFNVRLYLHQRTLSLETGASFRLLELARATGGTVKAYLAIVKSATGWQLMNGIFDDNGAEGFQSVDLPDPWPRLIELRIGQAASAVAADGFSVVYYNGTVQTVSALTFTDLDLYDHFDFDQLKVGMVLWGGIGTPSGYVYVDEVRAFEAVDAGQIIGVHVEPTRSRLSAIEQVSGPVLPGVTTNVWETRIANNGAWCAGKLIGRATDPVVQGRLLAASQRQILDSTGASVWRVRVDDTDPLNPVVVTADLETTNIEHCGELIGYSDNARPWAVTVNASGEPVMTALSSQWPIRTGPIVTEQTQGLPGGIDQIVAEWGVTAAGSITVTAVAQDTAFRRRLLLRAQDDSVVYEVTTDHNLDVTVADYGDFAGTLYYDHELFGTDGTRWYLQATYAGVLQVWNADAFDQGRYTVPLAIDPKGQLVVVDTRFKQALSDGKRSGWGNRRVFGGGRV